MESQFLIRQEIATGLPWVSRCNVTLLPVCRKSFRSKE
jgi:hypothetical protein